MCFFFVAVLKEAFRGFSHIRNAEQLGPHKRIIYTEAVKGKGKLSSFASAHTDKYKCTHEGRLTQVKYVNNGTHTPLNYCALEQLGALLRETMEGLDLTLQSMSLAVNSAVILEPDEASAEFFGEVRGDSEGSASLI